MKKLFVLAAFVCSLLALQTANAQNPITTLEHAGATSIFYGQNSLVDAYNASVNGDYLYLSTGYFTAPAAIAKGVKIIGAGHFPDSANVAKRTTIMSGFSINVGADSLRLEGLFINGDINYAADNSINYVRTIRCRLGNVLFNSTSVAASKNYCSYEECFIDRGINFSNYGNNLLLRQCICTYISNVNGGALIIGNIFLPGDICDYIYCLTFININSSQILNNIVLRSRVTTFDGAGNNINYNLFVNATSIDCSKNSVNNNYTDAQANIFVNQAGNLIDYSHDYHLKNPDKLIGTDGTQIGLYGETTPFKDKGLPSNPQVTSKTVGTQTDVNGNLQINFNVKAQDN